jgi:predicted AlkP superfamily phosphohydrolase/phosphomutase
VTTTARTDGIQLTAAQLQGLEAGIERVVRVSQYGREAFVLGLDGVPWGMLERWVEAGELPAFARLFEAGAAGPLTSTTPASTPLAWPSIFTGRRPDAHGAYWFRELQSDYTHSVVTSGDVRGTRLWDVVSPAAVVNVPMTYPARNVDGTLVAGMMTPASADGFTHPPEFIDELDAEVPEYRIGLDWQEYDGNEREFAEEVADLVDAREQLLELLLAEQRFRLGFFVFTAPDRLQHLVWDESVLLDHYRRLDDALATVQSYIEERDATLFVVSDHGFGPIDRIVSPNNVLERGGYLTRRNDEGVRGVLDRLGVDKSAVQDLLGRVGIDEETVVQRLPQGLVDMVAMQVPGENAVYDVDYAASRAFVRGDGCLYLNRTDRFEEGTVDPEEAAALKATLTALFENVTDPATGEGVLVVHDGAELFPRDPNGPDLVLEGVERYEVHTNLTDEAVFDADTAAASHREEGIVLASGPGIEAGTRIEEATVVDVLPTLLHAIDEAVPTTVDGDVLHDVFAGDSGPADRAVRYREYSDEGDPGGEDGGGRQRASEDVESRLRGLGYLG